MSALSKKEKRRSYLQSVGFVLFGLALCYLTANTVVTGENVELGRNLPSTHAIFIIGFFCMLWGVLKAFLTAIAFNKNE